VRERQHRRFWQLGHGPGHRNLPGGPDGGLSEIGGGPDLVCCPGRRGSRHWLRRWPLGMGHVSTTTTCFLQVLVQVLSIQSTQSSTRHCK
jgi:hypothetical protein